MRIRLLYRRDRRHTALCRTRGSAEKSQGHAVRLAARPDFASLAASHGIEFAPAGKALQNSNAGSGGGRSHRVGMPPARSLITRNQAGPASPLPMPHLDG
jgi:hypothetical protein